jgi:PcfK-like protein
MNSTEAFKKTIQKYLEDRASADSLFAEAFKKEGKNINDCVTYILNTVKASGCNGFADDEIYSMAVHYYDEDKIDIGKPINNSHVTVNHKVELSEEEKAEAKEKAIRELINETKSKVRSKDKPSESLVKGKKKKETPKPIEQTLF